MTDCLFCNIADGEIPAYKIYEDDLFFAILDRFPKCAGHILIIPKIHAEDLFGLPSETLLRLAPLARDLAEKLKAAVPYDGLNLLQNNGSSAGQTIRHFHLHLIPRYENDGMRLHWEATDPPPEEFERVAGFFD